jgi:hypothetical protein
MSNAIKHVVPNGITWANIKESNRLALVEIEKQGEHIPEDELEKV